MPEPVEKLCELLLDVAGRGPTNYYVARREARALAAAMEWMTTVQRARARERICRLEDRWGSLLEGGGEIDFTPSETDPVQSIARWLRRRRHPERILRVLNRAAEALEMNVSTLAEIHEHAFAQSTDRVMKPVTENTFRQWLIETRLAVPKKEGAGKVRWIKGDRHNLWIAEHREDPEGVHGWCGVTSSNPEWIAALRLGPLYAASLAEMVKMQTGRRSKVEEG